MPRSARALITCNTSKTDNHRELNTNYIRRQVFCMVVRSAPIDQDCREHEPLRRLSLCSSHRCAAGALERSTQPQDPSYRLFSISSYAPHTPFGNDDPGFFTLLGQMNRTYAADNRSGYSMTGVPLLTKLVPIIQKQTFLLRRIHGCTCMVPRKSRLTRETCTCFPYEIGISVCQHASVRTSG